MKNREDVFEDLNNTRNMLDKAMILTKDVRFRTKDKDALIDLDEVESLLRTSISSLFKIAEFISDYGDK